MARDTLIERVCLFLLKRELTRTPKELAAVHEAVELQTELESRIETARALGDAQINALGRAGRVSGGDKR